MTKVNPKLLVALILAIMFAIACKANAATTTQLTQAQTACFKAAKELLKHPSTARNTPQFGYRELTPTLVVVKITLKAENDLGQKTNTSFTCKVDLTSYAKVLAVAPL